MIESQVGGVAVGVGVGVDVGLGPPPQGFVPEQMQEQTPLLQDGTTLHDPGVCGQSEPTLQAGHWLVSVQDVSFLVVSTHLLGIASQALTPGAAQHLTVPPHFAPCSGIQLRAGVGVGSIQVPEPLHFPLVPHAVPAACGSQRLQSVQPGVQPVSV